ncbi:MAG: hypothetical protein H6837_03455 [Planctomycetes bacterium]|nr:hypothetical protein [Planctomycetota bacterium]
MVRPFHPRLAGANLLAAFAASLLVTACSGPTRAATERNAALSAAPAATPCRLTLDGDAVVRWFVPVPHQAIPEPVRRSAELFLLPEGELVACGREWDADGRRGYRMVKRYGDPLRLRSAWVDGSGGVLERSHDISLEQCPKADLEAARALEPGEPTRVEFVQGGRDSPGHLRIHLVTAAGHRWVFECHQGRVVAQARILDATLEWRSH